MKPDELRVALVGADDIHARELAGLLTEMGIDQARVLAFGEKVGQMELVVDDEEAAVLLPLEREGLRRANLWVLFGADAHAKSQLERWSSEDGAKVIDMAPGAAAALRCTDPFLDAGALREKPSPLVLPDPAALYLSQVLSRAPRGSVRRVDCHVFLPASAKGEPGIRELFQQSASLLNFKALPSEIWGRQLAFNIIPSHDPLQSEVFGSQVRTLSGHEVDVTRVTMQTSVFHGTAVSALVQSEEAHAVAASMRAGPAAGGRVQLTGEEEWCSLIETGALPAPVVNLRAVAEEVVWIWLLFDNVKAGKAALAANLIRALVEP